MARWNPLLPSSAMNALISVAPKAARLSDRYLTKPDGTHRDEAELAELGDVLTALEEAKRAVEEAFAATDKATDDGLKLASDILLSKEEGETWL